MKGYRTYITVGVTILFSIMAMLNIDLGLTQEQVVGAFATLIALAIGLMRLGSKNDAASATQAIVASLSTEIKGVIAGERVGTSDITAAVGKPTPVVPKK